MAGGVFNRRARKLLALGLALGTVGAGCSLSWSSRQFSNSVSSPFESSVRSSAGDNLAFQEEVRDFSYAWVMSEGEPTAFRRGVSAIAQKNGVSTWENDDLVLKSIGAGMRDAGINPTRMHYVAGNIFEDDLERIDVVAQGYHSAR